MAGRRRRQAVAPRWHRRVETDRDRPQGFRAEGERRARVGLFLGCVASEWFAPAQRATIGDVAGDILAKHKESLVAAEKREKRKKGEPTEKADEDAAAEAPADAAAETAAADEAPPADETPEPEAEEQEAAEEPAEPPAARV